MSRRSARLIAWSLWLLDMLVVAALLVADGASDVAGVGGGVLFISAFATTGALVASRVPANPVGWLLCLAALAFAVGGVSVTISESAVRNGTDGPLVTAAAWVGTFVWMLGVGPAATFVLLYFPDGRLPSQRWRPVAWLSGVALVLITVSIAVSPGRIEDTDVSNPVGIQEWRAASDALESVGLAILFACILASCASLVPRYRRADSQQRQQLKWLALSLPAVLAWLGASILVESALSPDVAADVANLLSAVGLTIIPVAIAIAILRHRLYDIDVVIKRTLVYAMLTAVLLSTYFVLVLALRVALRPLTGESDLAVAASTLAVAALFRPVRGRVQGVVDRRFYRSRYDAGATVEGFSARLRDDLDLDSTAGNLRAVVQRTMQPSHVSLWLRSTP